MIIRNIAVAATFAVLSLACAGSQAPAESADSEAAAEDAAVAEESTEEVGVAEEVTEEVDADGATEETEEVVEEVAE